VPDRLREVLTGEPDQWLDPAIDENPPGWAGTGMAGTVGVALVAIATFVACFRRVDSPVLLGVLLAASVIGCVAQYRRLFSPVVLAVWTIGPLAILNLLGSPLGLYDIEARSQASMMMFVWFVGSTAAVCHRRLVVGVTAAAFAIAIGREFTDPAYGAAVIWSAGIIAAFLAGLMIRSLLVAVLNAKLAEAAVSAQATTAERQRIAREVHDVIAHSLTVTMLHLSAARLAVARGDNNAATEALEEAEKAGRTSLNEIRNTVGLLRTEGAEPSQAPLPTAVDLPELVAGYRSAGVDVSLDLHGDLERVEPATGLALYRIVQESLTNAGRHAPGARNIVRVDAGPPLEVDVSTQGGPVADHGTGNGLTGMAERAAALGGSCDAGPDRDGWRVRATLP